MEGGGAKDGADGRRCIRGARRLQSAGSRVRRHSAAARQQKSKLAR